MIRLPPDFLDRPLAHRGLHWHGLPENSGAAFLAARKAGYGVELDVQLSADGHAVVFHDPTLDRMTAEKGPVRARTLDELTEIRLAGSTERIEPLTTVLGDLGGRSPVLIEIKSQFAGFPGDDARLAASVAEAVALHPANVAVMSFEPGIVAQLKQLAPGIPRGLTTEDFNAVAWPGLPDEKNARLTRISDYDHVGACFISHHRGYLDMPRVAELKSAGAAILCWTVKSSAQEAEARRVAHNITFEGYDAPRRTA